MQHFLTQSSEGYFYVLAYKIDLWFHSKIIFVSRLKASKFSSQELRIL